MQIEFTFWVFGENGNFDLRLFVMMMVVDFLRISTILVYIDFFDLNLVVTRWQCRDRACEAGVVRVL